MRLLVLPWLVGCAPGLEGVLTVEQLPSEALGTTYQYATYVHPDAVLAPGAPWLLVTDGDQALEHAAESLDREVRRGNAAPVVLVGIGRQASRDRDYTPWPETPADGVDDWDPDWGGGIEPFFDFVHEVVVPKAEGELGIGGAPEDRGVFGHSLGGLAAVWASTFDRATFRRFGASSPSLWWDAAVPLSWERPAEPPVTLFTSIGSTEVPPMNVLFEAYVEAVARDRAVALEVRRYHGRDHFTAPDKALGDALSALFPAEAP